MTEQDKIQIQNLLKVNELKYAKEDAAYYTWVQYNYEMYKAALIDEIIQIYEEMNAPIIIEEIPIVDDNSITKEPILE